jgi:hypothetical protein
MTVHSDPKPEKLSIADHVRNAYDELTFRTTPSYEELRYKKIDVPDGDQSTMHAKLIIEDGQLEGHITISGQTSTETFVKMDNQDFWVHSGNGAHILPNQTLLGYVQNVLGTPVSDPAFNYLAPAGSSEQAMDDDVMVRAFHDTIAAKSAPDEYIKTYVHEKLIVTPGGEIISHEGVSIGLVANLTPEGETDAFWFACLDIEHSHEPEYVEYSIGEQRDVATMPGKEVTITCRVEVRDGKPPVYCAYVHNPETGLMQDVGIPDGEQSVGPLLEQAIEEYLQSI